MKIDSYAMNLQAQSSSVKTSSVTESQVSMSRSDLMQAMMGDRAQAFAASLADPDNPNPPIRIAFSEDALAMAARQQQELQIAQPQQSTFPQIPDRDSLKLMLIEQMLSGMTGRHFQFNPLHNILNNTRNSIMERMQNSQQLQMAQPAQPQIVFQPLSPEQTMVVANMREELYQESSQMSFQAQGVINTSDGRQIQIDLSLYTSYDFAMSNTFFSQSIAAQPGNGGGGGGLNLTDPLILNFDGTLPEFTKDRYAFDLTIDGSLENIFMPTNGSGFLALDKNGNGEIDDGSELFGAQTGNGFAELAAYDSDGNGWIDEGDEIFSDLKIMFADKETGEFMLMTLKESGVGAIYLGAAKNGHEIKGDDNELVGVVQYSGVFLNENGTAGSIHHIDLTH